MTNNPTPQIKSEELIHQIKKIIPEAKIELEIINPQYGSYSLRVKQGKMDIEYVWGPLSGFGGSDVARPATPEDTLFDYADVGFDSLDEALIFLKKMIQKYI